MQNVVCVCVPWRLIVVLFCLIRPLLWPLKLRYWLFNSVLYQMLLRWTRLTRRHAAKTTSGRQRASPRASTRHPPGQRRAQRGPGATGRDARTSTGLADARVLLAWTSTKQNKITSQQFRSMYVATGSGIGAGRFKNGFNWANLIASSGSCAPRSQRFWSVLQLLDRAQLENKPKRAGCPKWPTFYW